jgi:hypothetical protein
LFAAVYAWLLLGQMPSPAEFTGGAFMLAGVVLVRVDEARRRALTDTERLLTTAEVIAALKD